MSTEKKSAASSSSKAGLSAAAVDTVKFDKLPKLTESSDFRTQHNTAETVLDALELQDVLTGVEAEPKDIASDEEKKIYKADVSTCTLFLFQTVDHSLYPILNTNKRQLQKAYKTLEVKFAIKTMNIFLVKFRKLF